MIPGGVLGMGPFTGPIKKERNSAKEYRDFNKCRFLHFDERKFDFFPLLTPLDSELGVILMQENLGKVVIFCKHKLLLCLLHFKYQVNTYLTLENKFK
jgi:hypothetical protein